MRWSFLQIGMLVAVAACGNSSDSNPSGHDGDGGGGSPGDTAGGGSGGGNGSSGGDSGGSGVDAGPWTSDGGPGTGSGADGGPGTGSGADGGPGTGPGADGGSPPPANCQGPAFDAWVSDPKMCVVTFATGVGAARQMAFAPNGDLFVNNGNVVVLSDTNKNGQIDSGELTTYAKASGLNHGLAFSRDYKYLYASSPTAVYRWAYRSGDKTTTATAEVVIKNIPGQPDHITRTLAFDSQGRLYVSVGSSANVDTSTDGRNNRQQIRRFTLPATIPSGGVDYSTGTVFASGMRNEVGLFIDSQDRLWGVENGRDNLTDEAGNDIHQDNPGERVNLVVDGQSTKFYGYPDCYAAGTLPVTMHADRSTDVRTQTDAWCQNTANVHPPESVMPAHWAPLGIIQYTGSSLSTMTGDFIITSHGSWNHDPQVGRLLAQAHYQGGKITSITPFVGEKGADGNLAQGTWGARPVDVRQGPDQAIYFSDDNGGRVFKIGYKP